MSDLEPMPPFGDDEMRRELDAERSLPGASPESRARVLAAVQLAVAGGAVATGAAVAKGASLGAKLVVSLGVLAAAGGVTTLAVHRAGPEAPSAPEAPASRAVARSPRTVTAVAPPSVVASTVAPAPAAASIAAPSASVLPPRTRPTVTRAEPATEPERPTPPPLAVKPASAATAVLSELASEQRLLESARRALARGEPVAALAAVERHAATFESGRLTEEREVLRIQALVRAGRLEEARTEAQRFKGRFPGSLLRAVVDYAVPPAGRPAVE